MIPTLAQMQEISGNGKADVANINSILLALEEFGPGVGLDQPHRLAHFLAQLGEESGGFRYDRELWGPTAAQKGYDTRTDLGNTPAADGDGKLYAGRGPLQVTGRANYSAFSAWAKQRDPDAPDFVAHPDMVNTDPWEGLSAIWFWSTRKLNALADANDIEQITKKINGGLNGYPARLAFYTRAALVLAGYAPDDVKGFQRAAQAAGLIPADVLGEPTQIDGDAGPKTRAALHQVLAKQNTNLAIEVKAAPVTEDKEVPVVPKGSDKRAFVWPAGLIALGSSLMSTFGGLDWQGKLIFGVAAIAAIVVFLFLGEKIVRRAKRVTAALEES